jgi:hypothetical protein
MTYERTPRARKRLQLVTSISITAYHEAGHAVLAFLHGRGVVHVTIRENASIQASGLCELTAVTATFQKANNGDARAAGRAQRIMQAELAIALGGPYAMAKHWPDYASEQIEADERNADDFFNARDIARKLSILTTGDEKGAYRIFEATRERVWSLLSEPLNWSSVVAVADVLRARGRISGSELRAIVASISTRRAS